MEAGNNTEMNMTADISDDDLRVSSLGTAFRIIEYIHENDGARLVDIKEGLGLKKSTTHSYLISLVKLGYLIKRDGGYFVSLKFLKLGTAARKSHGIYDSIIQEVDRLVYKTNERVQAMVVENGWPVQYYQKRGEEGVNTDVKEGDRIYFHATSLGKAYLANVDGDLFDQLVGNTGLPKLTKNTITSKDELREDLNEVLKKGYAKSVGERVRGMNSIGAPVFSQNEEPIAAISISVPKTKYSIEELEAEYSEDLKSSSELITIRSEYN